jgi:hypothetical protein
MPTNVMQDPLAGPFLDRAGAVVNVMHPDFGAVVEDGKVINGAAVLNAARAVCADTGRTLLVPRGAHLLLEEHVDLVQGVMEAQIYGTIEIVHSGPVGLTMGGESHTSRPAHLYVYHVLGDTQGGDRPLLRLVGMKNGYAHIHRCPYLQLWADASVSRRGSIAYSTFILGRVDKLHFKGEDASSWINENLFLGGRCMEFLMEGPYRHNNNIFQKLSMEGSGSTLTLLSGRDNAFENFRGEGSPKVTFGAEAWRNTIIESYSADPVVLGPISEVVSDAGRDNLVTSRARVQRHRRELFRIDRDTRLVSGTAELPGAQSITPGLNRLVGPGAHNAVFDAILPMESLHHLRFESDVSAWRPRVEAYDVNGDVIDPNTDPWMSQVGGWTIMGTEYGWSANRSTGTISIYNPAVHTIRLRVLVGSSANPVFRYLEILAFGRLDKGTAAVDRIHRMIRRPLFRAAGAPTQGVLHRGDLLGTDSGVLTVTQRIDTRLAAGASSGATTVTAETSGFISSGDLIGVELSDGLTHWTTVVSASGGEITLADGLAGAAQAGGRVVTNRWSS